jgi:hypothetical protein
MGTDPMAQSEILSSFRSAGGRMPIAELDFQLRLRGVVRVPDATLEDQLRVLRTKRYLRGPLTQALDYELTADGWDAATEFDTRDLWEYVQKRQIASR